jgi:hypothetical protein
VADYGIGYQDDLSGVYIGKSGAITPMTMTRDSDILYLPCGDLKRCDTNRDDPICVAPPKVAKASKEGDIAGVLSYKSRQCK